MKWVTLHPDFAEQYAISVDERAVGMFEDMFDIADGVEPDPSEVSKAKLRIDTRKWALARMNPKKYGDKIQQEVTGADGGPLIVQTGVPRANG